MIMKRKPTYRRKRPVYKRRFNIARRPRVQRTPYMSIKRVFWAQIWQPSVTTTADFWKQFQYTFASLPDSAAFASIYDSYKIKGIKLTFRPRYDSFGGNDTVDSTLPGITNSSGVMLTICKDPWNSTAPAGTYTSTNFNTFCEAGHITTYTGNKPFSVYVRPTVADSMLSGVRLQKAPWVPTTNTTLVHYAFQAFAHDHNFSGNFLSAQAWDIFTTFYIAFKGIR